MSNKVEILIEVDPGGGGERKIKKVIVDLEQVKKSSQAAGSAGRDALGGFAGGLGIPLSIAAGASAIAAGIVVTANAAVNAALDAATANRILKTDARDAGIELNAAKAEAKAFGEDLALSIPEATEAFTKFLRLVRTAGDTSNLDVDRKKFEDLVSAYSLTAGEIESISQDLEAGRAISLKRLGADPTAALREYAKAHKETVADLTVEEKARIRLNALLAIGARNQGAASERLVSDVGQWAALSKAIADAKVNLGEFLLKKTLIGDLPLLITNPLHPFAAKQAQLEAENQARIEAARREALAKSNAYFSKENENLPDNKKIRLEGVDATSNAERAGKAAAEAYFKGFENIFKDGGKLDPVTALFAERQFQNVKNALDPDKAKEVANQLEKFWKDYGKTALNALKATREAAEHEFSGLADRYAGGDNPFVKILTDADDRAKELRKTFSLLKTSIVNDMLAAEAAVTRQKLLGLQLDQQLKANHLRREADTLANFSGISGAEQRKLNQVDKQISAAESIPELLAKAEALSKGLVRVQEGQLDKQGQRIDPTKALKYELKIDPAKVQKDIFNELQRVNTYGLRGQAGRQATDAVNTALVNLFEQMTPELQARIAQGKEGVGEQRTFADAFKGRAESFRQAIREEIAKAGVADKAIEAARQDISAIEAARRNGLSPEQADKRLLATTGELSPAELTADIRQARIEALRREADRTVKAQDDATAAVDKARQATENLTKAIDKMAEDARNPLNRKLLIEITNKAKATVRSDLYGEL